jgi:hypothetical protein
MLASAGGALNPTLGERDAAPFLIPRRRFPAYKVRFTGYNQIS